MVREATLKKKQSKLNAFKRSFERMHETKKMVEPDRSDKYNTISCLREKTNTFERLQYSLDICHFDSAD